MAEENGRQIFVFGSLNIDLVQRVERLPLPGETLAGDQLQIFSGGKGANQACAAARLGGRVCMAGRVGNDAFGVRLRTELEDSGVDTSGVETSRTETGAAIILVLPSGENVIVISPGANGTVTARQAAALKRGNPGDILLCQLEVPLEATITALETARERGMLTILDPAPAKPIPKEALSLVSILIPNQTEAAGLLERTELGSESVETARTLASELLQRGPRVVIVKLGRDGCLVAENGTMTKVAGHAVPAVDTTAAGDTFSGGLAAELSRGENLATAVGFANAAAALCVTKPGPISSIPTRAAVLDFLSRQ